ncbi:cilia- and flagella-associated protein 300 [Nilaparvata lugens]|uniref:cilia- and flagella-associated protein 300 n=1 Tax=Nilaparvata lugens TaxID=108931 RepID=UPI00193D1718|nr:cilia- and flagella-associated protein 300 [Nilaparvata lugens]
MVIECSCCKIKIPLKSMKGHISIQYYSFNEHFNIHQRQEFVEAFFTDPVVYGTLNGTTNDGVSWTSVGQPLPLVKVEVVPCTVISLEFFDRLYNRANGVALGECGDLIGCFDQQIDQFTVSDNLRLMLVSEEGPQLYSEAERNQLLFRLFTCFCLGGVWAQHETNLKPYIEAAKTLYKDLVKVERVAGTSELVIRSIVLSVSAATDDGTTVLTQWCRADKLRIIRLLLSLTDWRAIGA